MRRFNTAGPCLAGLHYMLPPLARLPGIEGLVEQFGYFVLHAPRQSGKTTALRELATLLTASGRFAALHVSCEGGQAFDDNPAAAERILLREVTLRAESDLPSDLRPLPWPAADPGSQVRTGLTAWSRACPRPLVLLLDEIDALRGDALISVLRQLRAGFPERPAHFPASVVLCGLRDVRDYKAASGGDPDHLGTASPFNVKVESLWLRNFTQEEVAALYGQHVAETGQPFTAEAVEQAFAASGGQPWLVNALAREAVEKMGVVPPGPVTAEHIEQAKERLILARATHLDSLVARLGEERVRRIVGPLLAGGLVGSDTYDDDFQYVRDLGLVALDLPVRVANPIYREVIARVLSAAAEGNIVLEPRSFVRPDGRLDMARVLAEFADFWRQHGDVLAGRMPYHEVAPQLVLMAWLQRVVNGGGLVDREYGIGRGRIDLLVRWPHGDPRAWQREALELKVWAPGRKDPLPKDLEQLDAYLARLGLDAGYLVLFDRRPEAGDSEERTRFEERVAPSGRAITVLWA
jgi:hypothetical protein